MNDNAAVSRTAAVTVGVVAFVANFVWLALPFEDEWGTQSFLRVAAMVVLTVVLGGFINTRHPQYRRLGTALVIAGSVFVVLVGVAFGMFLNG